MQLFAVLLLFNSFVLYFCSFHSLYKSDWTKFHNFEIEFEKPLPIDVNKQIIWNGLGVFEIGNRKIQHSFDGFAKLVKIDFTSSERHLKDNERKALFSARLLYGDQFWNSLLENDIAPYLMFQSVDPSFDYFDTLMAMLNGLDNMNVNVVQFGVDENSNFTVNNDYATSYIVNISDLSVKSKSVFMLDGKKANILTQISSAHPLKEHATEALINFVSTVNPLQPLVPGKMHLVRLLSPGNAQLISEWFMAETAYMHGFAMTHNYAVIVAAPLTVDIKLMTKTAQPFKSLKWQPHLPTKIFVINLKNGERQTFTFKDGRFLMHFVNAFEDNNNKIIFYATAYTNLDFFHGLELKIINNPTKINEFLIDNQLRKYVIDLKLKTVTSEPVVTYFNDDFISKLEMPTINEHYRYLNNCFVFGITMKSDNLTLANMTLAKKSLCQGYKDLVWYKHNHYPCEPHFISKSKPQAEDDGYLISLILDGNLDRTYVAIFDAQTMKLINKAWLPVPLPYRLHGKIINNS